jgi:cell volume regulation protein A
MDGFAWLSQASMFLLLGLLATPSDMTGSLLPALAVALLLIFIARPIAVFLCLAPFHFSFKETLFIARVGLRGAVPVVLAIFPMMADLENARTLFNVTCAVVVTSLLIQGTTLAWVAGKLGLVLPARGDHQNFRKVFGDFVLDASISVREICDFYNLPEPEESEMSLGLWITAILKRPPIVGDSVSLGQARLVVRQLQGDEITQVGIRLP